LAFGRWVWTHLALLVPALTPWVLAVPSQAPPSMPRAPLPQPELPAPSVSSLAPHIIGGLAEGGCPEPAAPGVSCYALFKGWLPLSLPPPGLPPSRPFHWRAIGHLRVRSGLSPSRHDTLARPCLAGPRRCRIGRVQRPRSALGQRPAYPSSTPEPPILKYVSRRTSYHQA